MNNTWVIVILGLAAVAVFVMYQNMQASAAQVTQLTAQLKTAQAALQTANGKVQQSGTLGGELSGILQNIF
jgi:type II secretory pathway pseudopilin PulG